MSGARRRAAVGRLALAGLTGLWTGMVGLAIYRMAARIGSVPVPWGLGLSLLTLAAVGAAWSRLAGAAGALATGAGWFAVVATATLWTPGGDVLLGPDAYTLVLAGGGMLATGVVVARSTQRRR